MLKCKLDFFKFNSESEILKGPGHSEPSVSGLPVILVYPTRPNLWMMMPIVIHADSDLEAVYMYISISI